MSTDADTQAKTIADIAARCKGPDQFQNFDRAFRHSLTIPKEAVVKEEAPAGPFFSLIAMLGSAVSAYREATH
jgi:hypothetical protein